MKNKLVEYDFDSILVQLLVCALITNACMVYKTKIYWQLLLPPPPPPLKKSTLCL